MNKIKVLWIIIILLIIGFIIYAGVKTNWTLPKAEKSIATNAEDVLFIDSNQNFQIIVDRETGVQYIFYKAGYRAAITVRVNADGTPVTVPIDKEK